MVDFVKTRMTAQEYAQLPETTQPMELIYGELIIMPSPKPQHQEISVNLSTVLSLHIKQNNLGKFYHAPLDVYFDDAEDLILQPDLFFIAKDSPHCQLGADNYWHGAPDVCVEIVSPGSGKHDRVTKFALYEKYGVREYWLVEPVERFIEVYVLDQGVYKRHGAYDETQTLTSAVITGLAINLAEIFPTKAE